MTFRLSQLLIRRLTNINNNYCKYAELTLGGCSCKTSFRNYSSTTGPGPGTVSSQGAVPTQKKKKQVEVIPKITLIFGDDISVTTLEEAQKLSKRRDLKLVKIIDIDSKTQRPVYKLMTGSEYHAEDIKHRDEKKKNKENQIKGEKLMLITYKIADHDLEININKAIKWIKKSYEVRVVINGDASKMQRAEELYSKIEEGIKPYGRVVQKRVKGTDIKFQIIPPKKEEKKESNEAKDAKQEEQKVSNGANGEKPQNAIAS